MNINTTLFVNFIIVCNSFLLNGRGHDSILGNIQNALINPISKILNLNSSQNNENTENKTKSYNQNSIANKKPEDIGSQCKLSNSPNIRNFETDINKYATNISKGQCTEWADGRYYQLTGKHMEINGDAKVWARQAIKNGRYRVSNTPSVPSVAVFQPGTDGSGEYGHVGVVESVSDDGGKFCLSSWNSPNLGETSTKITKLEPGMQFIIRL